MRTRKGMRITLPACALACALAAWSCDDGGGGGGGHCDDWVCADQCRTSGREGGYCTHLDVCICEGPCAPDCSGRECGPDPSCGEPCGECGGGRFCTTNGHCEAYASCGDGTCDMGENCWGCREDCPCASDERCDRNLGCVPETSDDCRDHADCPDDELCLASECLPAYGRDYRIVVLSATGIPEDNGDGGGWDPWGGMPDPYIVFYNVSNGDWWMTPYDADTLNPEWDYEITPFRVDEATLVRWELRDDDWGADDPILGIWDDWDAVPISVRWIKDGGWESHGATTDTVIYFSIEPL